MDREELNALTERCRADQWHRWHSGDRVPVEAYLSEHPELIGEKECLLDLVYNEFCIQQRLGEHPQPADYYARFPSLAGELELLFEVDAVLEHELQPGEPDSPSADNPFDLPHGSAAGRVIRETGDHADQPLAKATEPIQQSEKLGSMIGPYKLLSVLGEGGFGTVYLADQEKPIHRRVALKIIKAGMDTRQVLARFEAERQALAMMDHPNIAKVFDAGSTESGRSYFAMELVHGEPITDYCDRHRLNLEERLGLFIPVCQAIQHAHQKGIIHRDIKPKNVLVAVMDDRPVPKIIDFGVAKAMAQPLTQQTVFTEQGQLIGTPEYMSPEQAEMTNLDIDTRSDIYSLGVLLYELLTGVLPFDRQTLHQAGFDEIRRIIREMEPPKPSTKISTLGENSQACAEKRRMDIQALRRRLRQELDWIVMKTLEKDRTRRYATAQSLAEDVQHYLQHEPVQAGPPGNWYRIRKYARRYRMPLSIAAAFVALLAVITILAVGGYYRESQLRSEAETARLQAEKEKEKAKSNFIMARDAVKKYYTQVADDPRLKPHNLDKLRRDLLESANEFYERLISQEADDPNVQYERVTAFIARGNIEIALGNSSAAETAIHKAIAAATRLAQIYGTEPEYLNDLATSHYNLGWLYHGTGRPEEAEVAYKEALASWKILAEHHPETPEYQYGVACCHFGLGCLYQSKRRAKDAEVAYKEAIATQKVLADKHPEALEYQDRLAGGHVRLGEFYQAAGRAEEAEAAYKDAIAICRALAKEHPEALDYQAELADGLDGLGGLYQTARRAAEAEAAHKEALAIWRVLAEKCPESADYQNSLASSYRNQGSFYQGVNRTAEAEAAYKEAIAIQEVLAEKHPDVPDHRSRLAIGLCCLGGLYQATGRAKDAATAFEEAAAIQRILAKKRPEVPDYQNGLATSHWRLGELYQATDRAEAAEAAHKKAIAIWKTLTEKHPEALEYQEGLANSYDSLGGLYLATGRTKEAEAAHKEALTIRRVLAEKHATAPQRQKQEPLAELYHGKKVAQDSAKASWSPDGRKLVVGKMPFGAGLRILDLHTEETAGRLDFGKDPAWSPGEGRWIAFVRQDNPANDEEIWIVEPSGENPRRIAEGGCPSWSSDGKTLFFHSRKQQKVFAIQPNEKGAKVVEVCEMPWSICPMMSPTARQISYTDDNAIHILDRRTKHETCTVPLPVKGMFFHSWSPDGKQIGLGNWYETPEFNSSFWILNLETKAYRKIASGPFTMPAWSPDGSKIAVDFRGSDCFEVWVIETKNLEKSK